MDQTLCQRFSFDAAAIAERIRIVGLSGPENRDLAEELQEHVIRPNVDAIIDDFYGRLDGSSEFRRVVPDESRLNRLKLTQRNYLLALGDGFDTPEYFEHRLRVGAVHQRVGVSLSFYQCSYRMLQGLLIASIPRELRTSPDTYESIVQFIIKITALDMSLAIETYHTDTIVNLQHSIESIREEQSALRKSWQTDSLTRVYSRGYAIQQLKLALADAEEHGKPLCVIMADLDHFKQINDRHGHLVGDDVLQAVASRMSSRARDQDAIGRYGGEEFIIIVTNTVLDDAVHLAERMRVEVGTDPVHARNLNLPITLSLGVAQLQAGDDAETLTARADRALYQAKVGGRNVVMPAGRDDVPAAPVGTGD